MTFSPVSTQPAENTHKLDHNTIPLFQINKEVYEQSDMTHIPGARRKEPSGVKVRRLKKDRMLSS